MTDELCARERALRKLPLSYSLALRLRAGVAAELVCEYVGVEDASLDGCFFTVLPRRNWLQRRSWESGRYDVFEPAAVTNRVMRVVGSVDREKRVVRHS